ncbi:13958_t:CDS:2 [Funneliformis caledonium]|uniref:13958_t:CDS:1 n=1 Tax=Funneliformis caledonium TaxID=1117310 RepID=A0A9N9EW05_9GLOM|nr:13958_t:CDS:2 [Funneliformis caledonium]
MYNFSRKYLNKNQFIKNEGGSLTFINPKILGPNSNFITSSIIKAAKESNFFKEPVKIQFDSIAPLVLNPTLTLIDIITGKNKSNNQQGRSRPPKQGQRSDPKDEWKDENKDYRLEDNEALGNKGIIAIIRQMSDSFKGIAKEIRDA